MRKSLLLLALFCINSIWSQTNYTANFHDTKGNINVNDGGQLEYSLPIDIPAGVKDVAPNISLTYVSNSGNGIAGYGWNITGLTSITRGGKNIEKDGTLKSVKLDNSDYYYFNGQRLILKSGTYGGDGAEYVTEKYSNIKIKSIGNISTSTVDVVGPTCFEVTFEDGSQAWYGNLSGNYNANPYGITPLEYYITKWIDAQGNIILYNYEQTHNIAVIKSILWGGNEILNKPNINEIVFNYIDRDLDEQTYVDGEHFSQNKLLQQILVKTLNTQYKKYVVNYFKNGANYQLVNSIVEYNANNEAANPVTFTYPDFVQSSIDYNLSQNNVDPFDNVKFTGDFNGDSYLDFVMNNGVVKLGAFNDSFTNISTNKTFNSNAQIVQTLLDENGRVYSGNGVVQYENGKIVGYIFRNNTFEKVFEKQVYSDPGNCNCTVTTNIQEADVDGDGISNIITDLNINCPEPPEPCDPNDPNSPQPCIDPNTGDPYTMTSENSTSETNRFPVDPGEPVCGDQTLHFIVDLKDPNLPISYYSSSSNYISSDEKYLDVDGDGKVESIIVNNSNYKVFKFTKSSTGSYQKTINFSGNLTQTKDPDFPVLYGDFNGDNKLDFAIPETENKTLDDWWFYMGTGTSFFKFERSNFIKYRKPSNNYDLIFEYNFYSTADLNRDGKSDIVHTYSYNKKGQTNSNGNSNYRTYGYTLKTYLSDGCICNGTIPTKNINFINGISFTSQEYAVLQWSNYKVFTAITSPIKSNNNYYDIFLYWETRLHKVKASTPLSELARIQSINQAGVTTNIIYKELLPSTSSPFYSRLHLENYPYFSIERMDKTFAVSQLQQNGKKQDFKYEGMTTHFQGRGMIGFLRTARSSWYADGFENTKIWTGRQIDPQNYGLPVKEWSIRTNNENLIFPTDLSVNNTQLLSLKLTGYSTQQLANGVDVILPQTTTQKDFLKDVTSVSTITYGNYYLPEFTEVNINNNFAKKTTEMHYTHNANGTGSNYFIGRPDWKEDIMYAYGDVAKSKDVYAYTNNLLQSVTKYNKNNTGWIKEQFEYDNGTNGVGNITKKITTNSIDSQSVTEESFYDTTSRFIIKKKDNLSLETNITYNNWGQVLTQTDPLGNILTNTYDNWGKLLTTTSSLGGTRSYTYEKFQANTLFGTKVTENLPDGDQNIVFTNTLGQTFKTVTKSFNQGKYTVTETAFDVLGRKIGEREPYEVTSITPAPSTVNSTTWNRIYYDDSVFPAKVTATAFSNGKSVQTSISGNTASIKELNGYGRTTSKTTDALGNIISSTDAGGTVTFSYNALGQNISANYQGNVVTTNYDIWGRKANFHDPANGTYEYKYDGLGKTKKIISPKGEKNYVYNANGLLASVNELSNDGTSTTKQITLNYNNFGQLTNKNGTSNNRYFEHNYTYYPDGRLESDAETFEGKIFYTQNIVYDNLGRIQTYDKGIESNGVTTETSITHNYKTWDGSLYQMSGPFNGTGKPVLWSLGTTNAKGQVLSGTLGKARVNNTYDTYGFLTNTDHWFWPPALVGQPSNSFVNINYSFDAVKNELNSRTYNAVFGISETFEYDNNNRLINWTNPLTGQMTYNEYDIAGRITQNGQVGDIEFGGGNSSYQATGAQLNPEGEQHYDMYGVSKLLQMISYNENNDPIRIDGTEFDYEFGYGLSHSRQIMYYGGYGDGNFDGHDAAKFTKYYSEANDFEILVNNETGQEKHIIYIGGSPYESEIIYIKNFESDEGQFNFLHKDYLGSILAITDFEENVLEQRHYDAWGNFTHLKVNGQDFVGAELKDYLKGITQEQGGLIVDRGYTSHEHLHGVELIHMNGRLYDPMLKRFLNADENIQDPYNTQNYNKYGYVMNNPLMYNDPSGEFWVAGFFLTFLAYAIPAAVIGAAIGAGFYLFQSFLTNSWSWGGFFKSILTGAATGFISGGLGQVFSAAGFFATVGNGALAGAGAGGVTSLFNGTSFLEGVGKGALIGGAVGALSWGINKLFTNPNGNQPVSEIKKDDLSNVNLATDDPQKYAYSTMKEFEKGYGGLGNYGVEHYYLDAPPGYGVAKDGSFYKMGFFKRNFGWGSAPDSSDIYGLTVGSDIYIPKAAFGSKALLAEVITHETGHVILNNSSMSALAYTSTNFKNHSRILDNWGHVSIRKMSLELATKNPWMQSVDWINKILNNNGTQFMRYLNSSKSQLDKLLQPLIKSFSY